MFRLDLKKLLSRLSCNVTNLQDTSFSNLEHSFTSLGNELEILTIVQL